MNAPPLLCYLMGIVQHLVLSGLLVPTSSSDNSQLKEAVYLHVGLAVVGLLVDLVADGITGSLGTGGEGSVRVLGNFLVGFLARRGT
jgi:hypothetical protein